MSVDILRYVDMKESTMRRLSAPGRLLDAELCDRCGRVCDARCRANALRQHSFDQVVRLGPRV
jgi:hypothetical protein